MTERTIRGPSPVTPETKIDITKNKFTKNVTKIININLEDVPDITKEVITKQSVKL